MSEIDTAMNLMFKGLQISTEITKSMIDVAQIIVKPINRTPENEMWVKAIENNNVNVIPCSGKGGMLLKTQLRTGGLPFIEYENMIFVLKTDHDQIQGILDNYGLSNDIIPIEGEISDRCKESFSEVIVSNEEEAILIKSRLDSNNVAYTVGTYGYKGEYKFVVADEDKSLLDLACLDAAIDCSGEYGKIITREIHKDSEYKLKILAEMGLKDVQAPKIYIADIDGSGIISDGKFTNYELGDINIRAKKTRNREDNLEDIKNKFIDMKLPTRLSEQEYEMFKGLSKEERKNFLIYKRREQGLGVCSWDELEIVIKHEKMRSIIEQKLRQQHPSEVVADANDYNCEQSLLLFMEAEMKNYEIEHDLAAIGNPGADILNEAFMLYRGYMIEDSDIDYKKIADMENDLFNPDNRDEIISNMLKDANIDRNEEDISIDK